MKQMKAARLHQRGGPEQVVVEQAPKPEPKAGEIRIWVSAAAITPGELTWDQTYQHPDGSPRLPTIPGHDAAGVVDALGAGVTRFGIGDSVYALIDFPLNGSAAEFVIVPARDVAPAPKSLSPEQAAAVPLSALTAWQALFVHGKLQPGQRVLVHGGSGAVGSYAVQLARWRGAQVIATASAQNLESVAKLGATEVIDYSAERFDQKLKDLDLVFDTVGGATLDNSFTVIRPGGKLVSITAMPDQARAAAAGVTGVFFIVRPSRVQLQQIAAMIDAGHLKASIQETFPLAQARQAFERSVAGHLNGKVVLKIE